MTEHAPPPDPAAHAVAAGSAEAASAAAGPRRGRIRGPLLAAALAFGAWGLWVTLAPAPDNAHAQLRQQAAKLDALEQRVATLSRSDQISRNANRDLQGTLAERDEEISGLRADVAFYERFVGATGQRRGLAVHEMQLQPQADHAWHYTATLTQNINRGAVSSGRITLSVEGIQQGKLRRLDWADLRQQKDAPGADYSFKYFQQVEGDIVLPPDFKPLRVAVRLAPQGGPSVEQSFTWTDATSRSTPGA